MTTGGGDRRGSLLEPGDTVFEGRFRIEEWVAEGGFAIVYKAWQVALDRRVALKVLKAPRTQDEIGRAAFREKFAAEAKTIARLRHAHIVDVYDFSVATLPSGEIAPWMALEWLEGETLAVHLGRRRRAGERGRDPREAVAFLRPAIEALAHAHGHGIAHRDIKPSNIMVTESVTETARGPSMRVLDFGIAKIMVDDCPPNTGNTRTESAPAFSPAYAAPEQVAFSRTGPWTDVHALGLLLVEVMTDEPPFSDADPEAHLFEQVMARRRPTPATKGRDVGAFEPILAKALALSPRGRWRSAGDLLAALEAVKASDTAADGDTWRATVVEGSGGAARRALPGRGRLVRLISAGTLVAAIVLSGASAALYVWRKPAKPISSRSASVSAPALGRVAGSPIIEPTLMPSATQDAVTEKVSLVPAPATAAPAASLTAGRRKGQKMHAAAAASVDDGRDLFDDTK